VADASGIFIRALRALTGRVVFRKTLPARFGGGHVYIAPRSDIRLLAPGWSTTSADLLRVAESYIRPGACVWDIGSNLGIFSACAAWKAGASGRVYAVEAAPAYATLQHETYRRLSSGYAPVVVLCAAVADTVGLLELAIPRKGHARAHLTAVAGNEAGSTEYTKQVVTVTADFLLQHWAAPDVVKVDIEGAEALFFAGAARLLDEVRPTFYVEVSEVNAAAVTALFHAHGYRLFNVQGSAELPIDGCAFNTLARPIEGWRQSRAETSGVS
jgi:FkbM family methyltransferase